MFHKMANNQDANTTGLFDGLRPQDISRLAPHFSLIKAGHCCSCFAPVAPYSQKPNLFDAFLQSLGSERQTSRVTSLNIFVPKARCQMVVDHADRLHVGVADRGADELKTPLK